jgi:hypothetical protein
MTTEKMMEPGPGIQGQLTTVLSLYQVLTNLHFLMVEQRASPSAASTRTVVSSQSNQLTVLVQSGIPQLSPRHQARLRRAEVLTIGSGRALTSEGVIQGLRVVDEVLAELISRAQRHARNQKLIEELVKQVQQKDETLKTTIKRLSVLRDQCHRLEQLGNEEIKSMDRAEMSESAKSLMRECCRVLSMICLLSRPNIV